MISLQICYLEKHILLKIRPQEIKLDKRQELLSQSKINLNHLKCAMRYATIAPPTN